MSESNSSEVEKVLLFISDARGRAKRARDQLAAEGAEQHVIEAVEKAQTDLDQAHRQLMQGTYFAVPKRNAQMTI